MIPLKDKKYGITKAACYMTNISMSIVSNLSPLLFLTFNRQYGISFTLLGLLVLINFCTQLGIDLLFSFFSNKFNIKKTVRLTPVITTVGILIFAVMPQLFPNAAYLWLAVGTVIFSVSGGLVEVLISPIIAALPAENPDREMSKLHSVYAWGVVGMVVFSTLFLAVFKQESWWILSLILMLIPLFASLLFSRAYIPDVDSDEKTEKVSKLIRNPTMLLCVACIFFGGASECTMAQWCSGYIENVFEMNKVLGDVFGVAMFAAMLGLGRTLYSKIGKHIHKTLLMCAIGATVCYVTAALSNMPLVGLLACGLTGLCTSMLWPGNLIAVQDRIPTGGVAMFAFMAAGGDLGASVGPQMIGVVTDMAGNSEFLLSIGNSMGIAPDQIGMKAGMLIASIFPLLTVLCVLLLIRSARKAKKQIDK